MSGSAEPIKQNHERITATTEHILHEFLSETSAHNQPCAYHQHWPFFIVSLNRRRYINGSLHKTW